MLTAYFDDSASEETDKLLVLAGYVHSAEAWARFSDDWKAIVDAVPTIRYFKMREAQNLSGEFLGWDVIARDAKVLSLADVIKRHEPWSLECSISRTDYLRIVRPVVPYDIRHPYFDAFYAAIIKLAEWHHHLGLTTPVDFVFDEQGEIGAQAVIWYEHIKSMQTPEIRAMLGSSPVFRDDKRTPPLQAADLLAWHLRRGREERNKNEYRPVMEKLLPLFHAEVSLGEEYLNKIAREMSEVPHIEMTTQRKDSVKHILGEILGHGRGNHKEDDGGE
ncbi:MAG: DUF3800 domain-containing protein [Candidatus Acidiferrales bacterium]